MRASICPLDFAIPHNCPPLAQEKPLNPLTNQVALNYSPSTLELANANRERPADNYIPREAQHQATQPARQRRGFPAPRQSSTCAENSVKPVSEPMFSNPLTSASATLWRMIPIG